jgi:hypothetical protein
MRTRFTFILVMFASLLCKAQTPPLATAVLTPLELVFPIDVSNCGSVAFNPINGRYYTNRIGNVAYPLLSFQVDGTLLLQDVTGQDSRGMWWNPNTNQLERNNFSAIGWAQIVLDGSFNATAAFNIIFPGALSPSAQCEGAYDPINNEVVFYFSNSIYRYNRATGALITSTAITGVTFGSINTTAVIYTGVPGYEYGILDYTAKKVILLDRATCAKSGETLLPATAVTATSHQFSYCNNLLWLFNTTTNIWNSYKIFDLPVLPIQDIILSGVAEDNQITLTWEAISDEPLAQFDVLHSSDGINFNTIGVVKGYDSGTGTYEFLHNNPSPVANYYRIQCYDEYQENYLSEIICIQPVNENNLKLYPNPAATFIVMPEAIENKPYSIININKQVVISGEFGSTGKININALEPGMYMLLVNDESYPFVKK